MAKNVHKVPKALWRKWDSNGQAMFNRLWDELFIEACFPHRKDLPDRKMLSTLRWNVCCMAAICMHNWRGYWETGDRPKKEKTTW